MVEILIVSQPHRRLNLRCVRLTYPLLSWIRRSAHGILATMLRIAANCTHIASQMCTLTVCLAAYASACFSLREKSCYGGDEENRTPDPLLARQVLSQLSYTPKFSLTLRQAFLLRRLFLRNTPTTLKRCSPRHTLSIAFVAFP